MDKYEKISKIASAVQNLTVASAIIIGGIWSAYTFSALEQIKSARVSLIKAEKELNEIALEINIDVSQTLALTNNKIGMLVEVSISNKGSLPITLDLQNEPLSISKVTKIYEGKLYSSSRYTPLCYSDLDINSNIKLIGKGVQPGTIKIISFYEEVEGEGLYFISFRSSIDTTTQSLLSKFAVGLEDSQILKDNDTEFNSQHSWIAQKYFEINRP